jgi:hypothetical protein
VVDGFHIFKPQKNISHKGTEIQKPKTIPAIARAVRRNKPDVLMDRFATLVMTTGQVPTREREDAQVTPRKTSAFPARTRIFMPQSSHPRSDRERCFEAIAL